MNSNGTDSSTYMSKSELFKWLKTELGIKLTNIEDLSNGSVYCIVINSIHPGCIPMHKVHTRARQEYEFISNFKLLQQGFNKHHIQKTISLERLIKGFDHIPMLQWMKNYYDSHKQPMPHNKPPRPKSTDYNPENSKENTELTNQYSILLKKLQKIQVFVYTYPQNPVTESLKKILDDDNN
jgi:microtubule-associated protein, RP/EB family